MNTPVEAVDEKEAVLSLLGLQSAPSSGETPALRHREGKESRPKIVAHLHSKEQHESEYSGDDDSDRVRSPIFFASTLGEPLEDPNSSDDDELEAPPPSKSPPKTVSPFSEHRMFMKRVILLKNMGKKRKHHRVVEGQFEDAYETSVLTIPGVNPVLNHQTGGGTARASSQSSGVSSPHLIKETSSDVMNVPNNGNTMANAVRLPNVSSMSVEDQFRHFLFMQQQQQQKQRSMMQEGTLSNPYFTTLMGNPGSMNNIIRPGDTSLDQQRLQMEAMMAFQAQVAYASRQHLGVAIPSGPNSNAMMMNLMKMSSPSHGSMGGGAGGANVTAATSVTPPAASVTNGPSTGMSDTPPSTSIEPSNTTSPTVTASESDLARHPPAAVAAITAAVAAASGDSTSTGRRHHLATAMEPPPPPPPPSSHKKARVSDSDDEEHFTMKQPKGRGVNGISTKVRFQKYKPPVSWRELAQVPKMPPVEADNDQTNVITVLREHDVLLGRGGLTNTNPGNVRFRALVSKHRLHYCMAPKGDKGALGRYLANYVRAMGGRFLAKASKGKECWYEVGDDQATKKCAQALREGTADFNRKEQDLI